MNTGKAFTGKESVSSKNLETDQVKISKERAEREDEITGPVVGSKNAAGQSKKTSDDEDRNARASTTTQILECPRGGSKHRHSVSTVIFLDILFLGMGR